MTSILIVDDDPTIRAMFSRALQSLGEVEQASNGADALRLLGARKFSVILLDLHMPVIDGFVILHTLATKPGPNRDTPIYVVTADASDQARIRALRRHAVFFLTKPVPIGTLVALVDSTLKKSAARAATPAKPGAAAAPNQGAGQGRVSTTPIPPPPNPPSPNRVSNTPVPPPPNRSSSIPAAPTTPSSPPNSPSPNSPKKSG